MLKDKLLWFLIPILILSAVFCIVANKIANENTAQRESVQVYTKYGDAAVGFNDLEEFTNHRSADYIDANDTMVGSNTTPNGTVKGSYFGNKNSKVYHKSSCGVAKNTKEENRIYFTTKDEYIQKGYSPCKSCKP